MHGTNPLFYEVGDMAGTEVTTGKLTQAANMPSEFISQYNVAVDKFYNCGAEIDTMWDGEASQKFMATRTGDRDRFNALTRILQWKPARATASASFAAPPLADSRRAAPRPAPHQNRLRLPRLSSLPRP
jgi:hypothetical protein